MSVLKDDVKSIIELCKSKENKELDFKLKLDLSDDKTKNEIAKDICAFANGENSGRIIIGVNDETKVLLGIDKPLDHDRIQLIVSKKVFPPPEFVVDSYQLNSKFVGIIKIVPGRAIHRMSNNNKVYVRRGAITDTATPEEIVILSYTRFAYEDVLDKATRFGIPVSYVLATEISLARPLIYHRLQKN